MMGRIGKWIRNFFIGKKEKESKNIANIHQITSASYVNMHQYHPATPVSILPATSPRRLSFCQRSDSIFVNTATATTTTRNASEVAAVKIQSVFRAHLAKRALKALKALVKLQALVRGHLVRKQAKATLKCMESLMIAQTRARAKRLQSTKLNFNKTEHIKISSPSSLSAITTDYTSPRTCSNYFEQYSFSAAYIGPFAYPKSEYVESFYSGYSNHLHLYPNYMADTESSRAKLRSNSVPKQRSVEAVGRKKGRRRSSS